MAKRKRENPNDSSWQDFKFIFGNEIYLTKNGLTKETYEKGKDRYFHFILLAKDEIGNKQIRELSSRSWQRSYMYFHRRVPTYFSDLDEIISSNPGHVIATSACLGSQIDFLIMEQDKAKTDPEKEAYEDMMRRWLEKIISIFGKDDFYLELQPGLSEEQILVNKKLLLLGEKYDVKCVVATDSHYLRAEDRPIHKAFLNSKNGEREVDSFYEAAFMMTPDEIRKRMDYLSDDVVTELFKNTLDIGDKCLEYSILKPLEIPYIPQKDFDEALKSTFEIEESQYPYFHKFIHSEEVADRQLAIRLRNFLEDKNRVADKEKSAGVLEEELKIVWNASEKMGVRWSKYFLQMADYMKIVWNEGDSIVAPSRGSAGASYLMYAIDVIQIDKTREKAPLLFERFLNPDRASVLDVDVDVESTKRGRVISALQDRYGEENVIRISTFKTETSKIAVKDAARGLGIDSDISGYISSLITSERGLIYTLDEMYYGNESKGIKPNPVFKREVDKYEGLWETARTIEGLVNGIG